jgi:isoleucyl-tRNA synthetase
VQNLRREKGFEIEETISVTLTGSPKVVALLRGPWGNYFTSEVLARELTLGDETDGDTGDFDSMSVDGEELWIGMQRLGQVGSG